jgi:hypothetical protein
MNYYQKAKLTDQERFHVHYQDGLSIEISEHEKKCHAERMQLLHLAQDLANHRFITPFRKKAFKRKQVIEATNLGMNLVACTERIDEALPFNDEESYEYRDLPPNAELTKKIIHAALSETGAVVDGVGIVEALPIKPDFFCCLITAEEIDLFLKAYNGLALTIRKALLTNGMYEDVKSFRRNATERYKRFMKVAEQGWISHNKILLIRLDWGFRKTFPAIPVRFKSQEEFERTYFEVDGYRKAMLKILQKMFGKDLVFYATKIECGEVKGFHMHWLIALNGSEHQDRINVPRKITDKWDANVGNGKTYTFNVNALRGKEESGLRVIDYHDPELWEIVGRYADYLTKVDYTMKLRLPEKKHSFFSTKLKTMSSNKTGPKRSYPMPHLDALAVRGPQGRRQLNQFD